MAATTMNEGCYLARFTPDAGFRLANPGLLDYEGTLRVEPVGAGALVASGDLYVRTAGGRPAAVPGSEVPVFPIGDYRYHLRVLELAPHPTPSSPDGLLRFEALHFDAALADFVSHGTCGVVLRPRPVLPGFPAGSRCYEGTVFDLQGVERGAFFIGWVCARLRRAVVELDKVTAAAFPQARDAAAGPEEWGARFGAVKWRMACDVSTASVPEPTLDPHNQGWWTYGELHEAMLAWRSAATNLNAEWRYHVMAVRRIVGQDRGVMFDAGSIDTDQMPREGAAVASNWAVPNTADWGTDGGRQFGDTVGFFRTAVHEVGHAMGLDHNTVDAGFMNTTDAIAEGSNGSFPANILWSFASDDQRRLKHGPDILVRPGGAAWMGGNARFPEDAAAGAAAPGLPRGFELAVRPLQSEVPWGAPVRLEFELIRSGPGPGRVPAKLDFLSGHVSGRVIGPNGVTRQFRPVLRCMDDEGTRELAAGAQVVEGVTLLQGVRDPRLDTAVLFPEPGSYRVVVEVAWTNAGEAVRVVGETEARVWWEVGPDGELRSPGEVAVHRTAAEAVFRTPETGLCLAFGGDHLVSGNAVIQEILERPVNRVLRRHYLATEAMRLAQRHRDRPPDLKAACTLLNPVADAAMTVGEQIRMLESIAGAWRFLEAQAFQDSLSAPIVKTVVRALTGAVKAQNPDWPIPAVLEPLLMMSP